MGVYIKDFEMPKDCDSCDIPNQIGCTLWIDTDVGHRHPDCPMREVPVPHGRLADCDAVEECLKKEKIMDDLIGREETLKAMDTWDKFGYDAYGRLFPLRSQDELHLYVPYVHYADMVNVVKGMPSAQKTGKWLTPKEYCQHLYETTGERYSPAPTGLKSFVYCSQCGKTSWFSNKYCPHCGSRNRGEEE